MCRIGGNSRLISLPKAHRHRLLKQYVFYEYGCGCGLQIFLIYTAPLVAATAWAFSFMSRGGGGRYHAGNRACDNCHRPGCSGAALHEPLLGEMTSHCYVFGIELLKGVTECAA